MCYRNTCLPSTIYTTKFPSALIIPAPLLFPITRLPSSVDHGGGSGCCCGCGSWCPERSCISPACVSPPHHCSTHQPPHEQLLMRLGGRCVICGWCVVWWSVVHHCHFHTPSTPHTGACEAGGAWVIGAMVLRARGAMVMSVTWHASWGQEALTGQASPS